MKSKESCSCASCLALQWPVVRAFCAHARVCDTCIIEGEKKTILITVSSLCDWKGHPPLEKTIVAVDYRFPNFSAFWHEASQRAIVCSPVERFPVRARAPFPLSHSVHYTSILRFLQIVSYQNMYQLSHPFTLACLREAERMRASSEIVFTRPYMQCRRGTLKALKAS